MAFEKVRSMISGAVDVAPPKDVQSFTEKDDSDIPQGAVAAFEAGTSEDIELCTGTSHKAALIALEDIDQDDEGRCSWIMPGQVYKAPLTNAAGTALVGASPDKAATINIGSRARINTLGTGVDGQNIHADANPLTIVGMYWDATSDDTRAKAYVYVVFNRGLLFGINS